MIDAEFVNELRDALNRVLDDVIAKEEHIYTEEELAKSPVTMWNPEGELEEQHLSNFDVMLRDLDGAYIITDTRSGDMRQITLPEEVGVSALFDVMLFMLDVDWPRVTRKPFPEEVEGK